MKKALTILLIQAFFPIFLMLNLKDMRKIQDLTGMVFGKLTVIQKSPERKYTHAAWDCLCECGNQTKVVTGSLRSGRIAGCRFCKSNTKHGMSRTREHSTWRSMKNRCSNPNNPDYFRYGARGIKVCDRWAESFEAFFEDMGPRPPKTTLDRKDVNGVYEKSNCRWSDDFEQCNNKRNNTYLTFNGQTLTQKQWCNKFNLKVSTIHNRLLSGMSVEEALTKPVRFRGPNIKTQLT